MEQPEQSSKPLHKAIFGFFAPILIGLLILAWYQHKDQNLHLIVLNTPGDAFLIVTPKGRTILIDGGNEPSQLASSLGRAIPYWQRSLDLIILTQISQRQLIGQISAIEHYQIKQALLPINTSKSPSLQQWYRLLREQNTNIQNITPQQPFVIDGVKIQALTQAEKDYGMLLLIEYRNTRAILAHHNHPDSQDMLLQQKPAQRTLLITPWEEPSSLHPALQAQHIILSKGYQAYEPSRQTWRELQINNSALYHLSTHGQIEWISNGQQTWVNTALNP
jgi:beta-lactamase superfamily II metal-dependent hydrolase